jgi:hypothetical protein
MLVIPTQPIASQVLNVVLENQQCTIRLYQKSTGLYFDLLVNTAPVVAGVLCQADNFLVRYAYLGFRGDLVFYDLTPERGGTGNVASAELGSRYFLAYLP